MTFVSQWKPSSSIADTKLPRLFGVCFGHQIIARAFGGVVAKNVLGWEIGYCEISLNSAGKRIFDRKNQLDTDMIVYL